MNTNFEQPDWDTLAAISRDYQVEMQNEARTTRALGQGNAARLWPRLIVALCILLPIIFFVTRTVTAAINPGGAGGFVHFAM